MPTSMTTIQPSMRSQHTASESRHPADSGVFATLPARPQQQQQLSSNSLQHYAEYNQQAQDVYTTLSQPFTFNSAPMPATNSSTSSKYPFQSNGQEGLDHATTRNQLQKQNLPPSDSPGGGSESAFAQSFYKAEGPGLNHFHTVLSREFNVPEGASPAAAGGTVSSQAHDPSSIVSEVGFSPANSDVALPAHMERDLIALADLTPTQQTLFGLYWCFVHVQWPIGEPLVGIAPSHDLEEYRAPASIADYTLHQYIGLHLALIRRKSIPHYSTPCCQ